MVMLQPQISKPTSANVKEKKNTGITHHEWKYYILNYATLACRLKTFSFSFHISLRDMASYVE